MPQKQNLRIELRAGAMKLLGATSDKRGMTNISMMSRLVEWFVEQDSSTQLAAMGRLPGKNQTNLAKPVRGRMAKRK